MARISRKRTCSPEKVQSGPTPVATPVSAVDQQRQQDTADCLGVARCPWCRGPLVARMSCAGPYWHCLCAESAFGPRPGE
jgi:hypothetical protein